MTRRSAFVTGVSGFAGRHLASQLASEGWEVAGTVWSRTSGVSGVAEERLQIDDRDGLVRLLRRHQPSVVFHLAAIVDTVTTPDVNELRRVNVGGTVAVTEAISEAAPDSRLVYTSSSFAYGRTPDDVQPVREEQPLEPLTPYGISKAESEIIVGAFARNGFDVVVTRAFQHTGPGHTGEYAMADWARQLALIESGGGTGAIVTGNLDVQRDYLDVRDVAAAYAAVAARGETGTTYNVCSGEPVSMRTLLTELIEAFGVQVEIRTDAARMRTVDQPRFYGDASKVKADTGWEPHYRRAETLAALAATAREQQGQSGQAIARR